MRPSRYYRVRDLDSFLELLPQREAKPVNGYYVYGLVLDKYGTCYVGKGKGDRVFQHFANLRHIAEAHFADKSSGRLNAVYRRIYDEMLHLEQSIDYKIYADGLSEKDALAVESAQIKKLGRLIDRTGKLFNLADGGSGIGAGYYRAKARHAGGERYLQDEGGKRSRSRPDRRSRLLAKNAFGQFGAAV